MPTVLIIDDEAVIRFSIRRVLASIDVRVLEAESAEEGMRVVGECWPDVILLDICLRDRSGLDVFHDLRLLDPKVLIVFITGQGTTDTAIEAMKLGAFDYLGKPLDAEQLRKTVAQALDISRLMHVPAIVEEGTCREERPDRLIGSGIAMQTVCKQIGRVASQDVNVMILGESGTGKELVARAIYHHSLRNRAPFLAINCAAIPESLLESELFGYEKGAFTGAEHRRIGKFEQAHGGTLLLDEIGDMASHTQAKILRLLQEKSFERLGGSELLLVDVRIIAATNQNLDLLIEQGRFRKDLFYRLRGVTIHLPSLRERREDIPELAHYFLFRYNRQIGTTVHTIANSTLEILAEHDWPGNVRELQSVIREALIVSAGSTLLPEFLPADVRHEQPTESGPNLECESLPDADQTVLTEFVNDAISRGQTDVYRRALEHFDRLLISQALRQSHGQQNRAAEILGLSRATLRAKIRNMRLSVAKVLSPQPPDNE
ncbi:MAG: sigma-54-dependent transcriptional regulator [Thermoguttaceae bacterium]